MKKDLLGAYSGDASQLTGKLEEVFHPESVGEVQKLVREAPRICIRGAGTGLAGGAVPKKGDVVLDLSKMRKISNFNKERKIVEVEAGVILDDLQDFLKPHGLEFPVKPSSHAVCTIGGMVSTNAVGNRGVRYGNTGDHVRWVEVVDGDGGLSRKGVTEMSDFVGMEGITGVIVRVCLNLSEVKGERSASLVRADSLEKVVELVRQMKRRDDVCALEFMDKMVSSGIGLNKSQLDNKHQTGQAVAENEFYHLLIEFEGDEGSLKGEAYDKVMAKRDEVYPFVAGEGYSRIEDPKIMLDRFVVLMSWLEKHKVPTFGHIGVGILHPCFNVDQERLIPEMMKLVGRLGGRVSGEHGIGSLKRGFVEINDQKILRNIKKRCDWKGKFNIGKVI